MSSRVLNLLVKSLTLEKPDGRGFQDACGCLAVRFRLLDFFLLGLVGNKGNIIPE